MEEYGIGGTMRPDDASEAVALFDQNRTLLVQKLTGDDPVKPEVVHGLQTPEQVFEKFQPQIDCEFEGADGSTVEETINFTNVGDFSTKSLTQRSNFLNDLKVQNDQYLKILKIVKSHKILHSVMGDNDAKTAFIESLKGMLQELEDADNN